MKKLCSSSRELTKNIIYFKKMLPLTKEEFKLHEDVKVRYICGKGILQKLAKNKIYRKVRDYYSYTGKHRDSASSICHLKLNVPNEIPVVFHNGSNYKLPFYYKKLSKSL